MAWLFPTESFSGFGTSVLHKWGEPRVVHVCGANSSKLLQRVAEICPRGQPGVYALVNGRGELYYLGKAKCLRSRLLGYFCPSSCKSKSGRLARLARSIWWEPVPDEFAALLREQELIHRMAPACNVRGMPGERFRVYLEMAGGSAPYLRAVRVNRSGAVRQWGPLSWTRRLREAVRAVNLYFRLRACPTPNPAMFPLQKSLPMIELMKDRPSGCLRLDLGLCLAPCMVGANKKAYVAAVQECLLFLAGDTGPTLSLERQMLESALEMDYERAAILRDRMQSMTYLQSQLLRLKYAWEIDGVHAVLGPSGRETWYLLYRGRVIEVMQRPKKKLVAVSNHARMLRSPVENAAGSMIWDLSEIDQVLLVVSWLKKNAVRVGHRLWTCAEADNWVTDSTENLSLSSQNMSWENVADSAGTV